MLQQLVVVGIVLACGLYIAAVLLPGGVRARVAGWLQRRGAARLARGVRARGAGCCGPAPCGVDASAPRRD